MSYAVIRTGGKQYRVSPGSRVTVEKLPGTPGEQVEFAEVLLRGDGERVVVGTPLVEGVVRGVIVQQDRGPRILVFKKKRRKNYRRRMGHRQYETTVQITSID